MLFSTPLQLATATAILLISSVHADLGKKLLYADRNNFNIAMDNSFWPNLHPTQSHWDQWAWGWIPQSCFNEAVSNGVSPYDVEVFNVWYDDCEFQWVFCRHHNALNTQLEMIDMFGRMPVHMRQWVRHVQSYPFPGGSTSAYMYVADTVFLQHTSPRQVAHEVGHAVDFYMNGQNGGIAPNSATSGFQNAVNRDTCVPDSYANTALTEDFTIVATMNLYEYVTPGGLDVLGVNWRCLENQKNFIDSVERSVITPGGRCTRRWPNSQVVSMGPATGNGRVAKGPKPDAGPTEGQEKVSSSPEVGEKVVTLVGAMPVGNSTHPEAKNIVERQMSWQAEWEAKVKGRKAVEFTS